MNLQNVKMGISCIGKGIEQLTISKLPNWKKAQTGENLELYNYCWMRQNYVPSYKLTYLYNSNRTWNNTNNLLKL
jgi:hypothetical protein